MWNAAEETVPFQWWPTLFKVSQQFPKTFVYFSLLLTVVLHLLFSALSLVRHLWPIMCVFVLLYSACELLCVHLYLFILQKSRIWIITWEPQKQLGFHVSLILNRWFLMQEAAGAHGIDVVIEMLANVNLAHDLQLLSSGGRVMVRLHPHEWES